MEEVCQMVWKLQGGRTSMPEVRKKLRPIFLKWDVSGDGNLQFVEFVSMVLCDTTFALKVSPEVEGEVLAFMNAENPQVKNGQLIIESRAASVADKKTKKQIGQLKRSLSQSNMTSRAPGVKATRSALKALKS